MNFLASSQYVNYIVEKVAEIDLNWVGVIIRWLIEGIGIIGVGIIVFTLALKTLVLPLDIYSRYKQKKQSLIMKSMRPYMEKLQKQYANDKNMYQQKVMELQKANGYSMLSSCLPLVVSLVIFIYVFSAFSTYSQYANLTTYNNMVDVYNSTVSQYVQTYTDDEGNVCGNDDGFLIYSQYGYTVDFEAFSKTYNDISSYDNIDISSYDLTSIEDEIELLKLVDTFFEDTAAQEVYYYYYGLESYEEEGSHNSSFLWIKNIWYPDSMFSYEIPSFSSFKSAVSRASVTSDYESSYNKVTAKLETAKSSYNGYFVLILLSIGGMVLSQFISMRATKDANELSSIDGQAQQTNKMLMWMMPFIYGIFSFFYSASFSIYMVTNTVYTIITTLIINKVVDIQFAKQEEKASRKRFKK